MTGPRTIKDGPILSLEHLARAGAAAPQEFMPPRKGLPGFIDTSLKRIDESLPISPYVAAGTSLQDMAERHAREIRECGSPDCLTLAAAAGRLLRMSQGPVQRLKTHLAPFAAVWAKNKTHEVRKNDRNFSLDDLLILREYDEVAKKFTGRAVFAVPTYMTEGGSFGLPADMVVLSIREIGRHAAWWTGEENE